MWQVVGGFIMAGVLGFHLGAMAENWYMRHKYRIEPRGYFMEGL